jgi:fructose-bisphosphate aldolase class II
MPLVKMNTLLDAASKGNYAVGAFNIGNLEHIIGSINAAEDMNTPIILQLAEGRLNYFPMHLVAPMMIEAAKNSKVDIAVHLDHGRSTDIIKEAIRHKFTSIMFDGSNLPYEENVQKTKELAAIAKFFDVNIEAELGVVGGNEGTTVNGEIRCTDPNDALDFCERTKVDALAVAIGNAHGNYVTEPKLNFDVLEQIHKLVDIPLVLHGGTGISDEDFRRTISLGIRKINIATALLDGLTEKASEYFLSNTEHRFFDLREKMIEGTYEKVKHHIKVFNNKEPL